MPFVAVCYKVLDEYPRVVKFSLKFIFCHASAARKRWLQGLAKTKWESAMGGGSLKTNRGFLNKNELIYINSYLRATKYPHTYVGRRAWVKESRLWSTQWLAVWHLDTKFFLTRTHFYYFTPNSVIPTVVTEHIKLFELKPVSSFYIFHEAIDECHKRALPDIKWFSCCLFSFRSH